MHRTDKCTYAAAEQNRSPRVADKLSVRCAAIFFFCSVPQSMHCSALRTMTRHRGTRRAGGVCCGRTVKSHSHVVGCHQMVTLMMAMGDENDVLWERSVKCTVGVKLDKTGCLIPMTVFSDCEFIYATSQKKPQSE